MLRRTVGFATRSAACARPSMRLLCSENGTDTPPWKAPMPDSDFEFLRKVLAAPSPVGLEGAMTHGVLEPEYRRFMPAGWKVHRFKGNAGIVVDSQPDAPRAGDRPLNVMIIGHADKIRMQVRSIGGDGKIFINSDSFLPMTLLGNEVTLFSEDPKAPGSYRSYRGGTVEAIGAIHFADAATRSGTKGVRANELYLDLQIHGKDRKKQVEELGIRPGDSILLDRPIKRGFAPNTFYGAYLDNGLGCYVTAEVARLVAAKVDGLPNVRCMFATAAYEEIGRFGSRVLAGELAPDVIIAVDVNHDYVSAPSNGASKFAPLEMGKGATISAGAIASESLNRVFHEVATERDIPLQRDVCGHDTGTDAMAGVMACVDAAATSIGMPVRNMHTVSESGHTGDLLAAIHLVYGVLERLNEKACTPAHFMNGHPRLDEAAAGSHVTPAGDGKGEGDGDSE